MPLSNKELKRLRDQQRRNDAKAKGLCIQCTQRPVETSSTGKPFNYCTKCNAKRALSASLRRSLVRTENTVSLYALHTFIHKALKEGLSEDTLLNISHDRFLDLSQIFARKR